jgi:hypothetical protein
MRRPATRIACLALLAAAVPAVVRAQNPAPSPQLAKQLVEVMTSQKLDALAVRDPASPDRAIAALAFPNSQLLVVSATYPDPAGLDALLTNKMYRDVYAVLQQPSVNKGKIFIQDIGCDGLQAGAEAVDIVYEDGTKQTILDGDWKKQGLKQADYQERAARAETHYSRLLSALLERTKGGTL